MPLKPIHYKKKVKLGHKTGQMTAFLNGCRLNTVCESARCPNQEECFGKGVATFMVLGSVCSRNCQFCAVENGTLAVPDPDEPQRIALAIKEKRYNHAVITSVTRDDLPDGGAGHFTKVIKAIRSLTPGVTIEVLIPDFNGDTEALLCVLKAGPKVLNHNLETAAPLYNKVRPQADYQRSLQVLKHAKAGYPELLTKSGFMVGLGETNDMIKNLINDLRSVGCDILTIGQYFQPTKNCLPVERYVEDHKFREYERQGMALGFKYVAAGRFVRSSYRAGEIYQTLKAFL